MERRFLLAIVLCFAIFVGWNYLYLWLYPRAQEQTPQPSNTTSKTEPGPGPVPATGNGQPPGGKQPGGTLSAADPEPSPHERITWHWTTDDLDVEFDSAGGSIASIHLLQYQNDEQSGPLELFGPTFKSGPGLLVDGGENAERRRYERPWEIVARDDTHRRVTFRHQLSGGRSIDKTIQVPAEGYALTLTIQYHGDWPTGARYRVFLPERVRNERSSQRYPDNEYSRAARLRGGGVSHVEHKTVYELNQKLPDYYSDPRERSTVWGAISSIYFGLILRPLDGESDSPWKLVVRQSSTEPVEDQSLQSLPFQVGFERDVAAGQSHSYEMFCAPKSRTFLADYEEAGYPELISYPSYIGWLTKLFFMLLSGFHWAVGSWGISIIILTFFVKLALHPINRKNQTVMMDQQKKMAKIQPKMKEIKERYPNDAMKANREIQELMREHGVNPAQLFGGCLLMFLQLPIWIALIMVFSMDLDLRQEGFLWIKDLTQPDRTWPWTDPEQPFTLLFFKIDALNILPVLYVIVTLINQRFMPKSSDPQAQTQQTMMKWMMVMFGVIFYNFASGLLLYFLTSSTLGILESWMIRRELARREEEAKRNPPPSRPAGPGGPGGPGGGKKHPGGGSKKKKKPRGAAARR